MLNSVDFPAAQRQYYDQLFKLADVDGDGYIGVNDSAFFKKSNLPNPILGEVWQLADIRQEGRLDKEGFVIAMSLISFAQQGKRLGLEVLRTNVPPPPKMQDIPPMKQDLDWTISSQEKKQWLDIFKANDDDADGFITGVQARNLFGASGLPLPLLSQIWGLADINKDQRLDQHEFLVAMYLISIKRRGYEVPSVVPDVLIASAWPDPSSPTQVSIPQIAQPPQTASIPKGNEWIIPPAEKLKYDDLFKKTDSDLDGLISGEQARHLFSRSGVPMGELSRIWLLSDINQDQRLDKQEFAIAMFLIRCRLQGRDIPTPLPEALISSSRDDFVPPSPVYGSLAKDSKSRYDVNLDDVNPPNITSPPPPSATSSMPSGIIGSEGSASTPNLGSVSSLEAARRFNSTSNLHGSSSGTTGSQIHGSGQFLSGSAAISPAMGMSPAVSSAPAILQPGGPQFVALSPTFGSVNLVPSTALEVERTRQSIAHHERTKSELTGQLQETTNAANESVRVLEEERARADVLVAEIGELESQIGAQRARGASYKDNITAIRLEVKNMATQKEQFEDLLTQKRLQCEDQEQILNDLRIELTEKTTEVERYQRDIDQLKTRLETLRTATSDIKVQLAGAKKHITDNKSEINRLTEEVKGLKTTTSSPPLTTRASSPMSYSITPSLPALHPPVTRTTSAFLNESIPTSVSSPHSQSLTSSPATTPFSFPPPPITDTFSFDNGHEDPFAFSSKDGFGLAGVTADSFGSAAPVQTSPSPPHPTQDAPVFNDANSFFATNDAFGEAKDPFSSTGSDGSNDPFASTPFPGSFDSFGAGAGSVISETGTQFIPPTPHNTVVGEKRQGALSSADIANAFSAAAFGGSTGAETTSSFFGTHDETFGASAFGNTTNDSFGGSSDAFGSTTHDTFGSTHDAFGSGGGSLRDSGGFHESMFSTPFPPVEGKHGGVTPFPSVDQEAFAKHGGMTPFPSVDQESFAKHGGMTPFPSIDQESFAKQHGGKTPYPSVDQESFAKIHGGKTPYPSVDQESFAKMHGGKTPYPSVDQESFKQHHRSGSYPVDPDRRSGVFQAAMLESDSFAKRFSGPPKILASEDPHPFGTPADAFGNDTFGSTSAFGSSEGFGTADAFGTTSAFGSSEGFGAHSTTTSDAFGSSSDAFGNGNDVFGSGENTFGSTSSSGDMFGKADAFGKDAFGSTGFGSHLEERPVDLTSSGSVADEAKFGDDVFGKADGFGTFNFNDKKDDFNF